MFLNDLVYTEIHINVLTSGRWRWFVFHVWATEHSTIKFNLVHCWIAAPGTGSYPHFSIWLTNSPYDPHSIPSRPPPSAKADKFLDKRLHDLQHFSWAIRSLTEYDKFQLIYFVLMERSHMLSSTTHQKRADSRVVFMLVSRPSQGRIKPVWGSKLEKFFFDSFET